MIGGYIPASRHACVAAEFACLCILFTSPAACQGRVEGRGAARRFVSQKYGFSIAVPVNWGVPKTVLDTPVFMYAPPAATFGQATIPKGGAIITVECLDSESGLIRSATTPEEWARLDARAFAAGSASIKPVRMPKLSESSNAVLSSYDEPILSPDQKEEHSVAIFWQFGENLFAAHLRYNANDSSAPRFDKIFLQTISSIRPLEKSEK